MSKKRGLEAIGMLGNLVMAATVAYSIILILKQTPLPHAGKPASK